MHVRRIYYVKARLKNEFLRAGRRT